ncbi:hypothetical protein ACS0TY_033803 [Phlomoides rotata]
MLTNATWTLSNFCRGKPQPVFEQVKPTLPALQHLVHSNDEEVLTYACWLSLSSLMVQMTKFKFHPSPSVLIPALRTIGNIVIGDDLQTQSVISHDALPCLLSLLTHHHKKSIKKEACWTI